MTIAVIEHMAGETTPPETHAEAHPGMVDPAGKLRRDGHGRIVFALGKHCCDPAGVHDYALDQMLGKDCTPSTLAVSRDDLHHARAPPPDAGASDEAGVHDYPDPNEDTIPSEPPAASRHCARHSRPTSDEPAGPAPTDSNE